MPAKEKEMEKGKEKQKTEIELLSEINNKLMLYLHWAIH